MSLCSRRRCVGNAGVLMQVLVGTVGSVDFRPSHDWKVRKVKQPGETPYTYDIVTSCSICMLYDMLDTMSSEFHMWFIALYCTTNSN